MTLHYAENFSDLFRKYHKREGKMKNQRRSFCDFLQLNNILCGISATDGKAVLSDLMALLKKHAPDLDTDFARREVESREALFPTMVAPGLAVPHARISGLAEPLTAVACIPGGCDFGGSSPARVMVLLLTPVDDPNLHLQLLSALAKAFEDPATTEKISRCGNANEFMSYFTGETSDIADYLTAKDLMEPFPALLQETDSLLDAIGKFAVTRSEELPVIDNSGDLRGVLSLTDLLEYSLPAHLLWLEDLSPMYRLQPFSDMLKTAGETKVADVMREEFVRAETGDPAVKLAKIFLMEKLSRLVIVDASGKPAGVVTLEHFSAKLFWD